MKKCLLKIHITFIVHLLHTPQEITSGKSMNIEVKLNKLGVVLYIGNSPAVFAQLNLVGDKPPCSKCV